MSLAEVEPLLKKLLMIHAVASHEGGETRI
jgi:hypothetical protein